MQTMPPAVFRDRAAIAAPFLAVALLAIVAGGLLAAVVAHAPSRALVWMVAYLVLVVGVAQALFGVAQAWLAGRLPSLRLVAWQCMLFNLGNTGVITGTLMGRAPVVVLGTAAFTLALVSFLAGTRGARPGWPLTAYRVGLGLLALGAATGVSLVLVRAVA